MEQQGCRIRLPLSAAPLVRDSVVVRPAGQLTADQQARLAARAAPFVLITGLLGTAVGAYAGYQLTRKWLG